MVKLLFAGSLILLVAGCRGEAGAPKVSFVETRVDESQSPLPFVIALANAGGAATDVDGVSIKVADGVVLPGAEASADDDNFETIATDDCRIEMREGHPTAIPARGDGVACGFVTWNRPQESPVAAAAVSARFWVTLADGATIETPAKVFLLSSEAGRAEQIIDGLSLDREQAAATLRRVESLQGERTPAVDRLIDRLERLSQ